MLLVSVAALGGALYVAIPVFWKTWRLTLVALAAGLAFAGVPFVRAAKKELPALRRRMGQCAHCGYDLTGNVSGVCPECSRGRSVNSTG